MIRTGLLLLGVSVVVGAAAYATDFVTLQGERTVYTADCKQGVWKGDQCTGILVAGNRYRFRALKSHGEVLFWTSGVPGPIGKFTECEIANGRNWSCKPNADGSRAVAHAMVRGRPVLELGRAVHSISKPRWWLLKQGVPTGNSVSDEAEVLADLPGTKPQDRPNEPAM